MKVILSHLADLKLKYYVESIDYEISGVGLVEKKDGDIVVKDIFLIKQEVSHAETKLNSKAVSDFLIEKCQIEGFPVENIKLWWHSHVNMQTFWSQTDDDTIDGFDQDSKEDNWYLSIVCNKQGHRRARVDIYYPFRVVIDELQISTDEDHDLEKSIKEEVNKLVSVKQNEGPKLFNGAGEIIGGANFAKEDDEDKETSFYRGGGGGGFNHKHKNRNKYWKH